MKILLYIYLGISVLTLLMYIFTVFDAAYEFKRRYPNVKNGKTHLMEDISAWSRAVIYCFLPIVNAFLLFSLLFNAETLKEHTIEKVYLKLTSKEKQK